MEELEGFLMQEDLELLEQLWPASSTMVDDASLNLNQFWGMEFLDVGSFESELGDVFFIPQEDTPSCFTNTEQENTNLYDQYIAREPEQEQEEEREQQHVVQPLRPLDKDEEEEEEEEEEEVETDDKSSRPDSKNLVSERNRRKRLNRQLFTLRSLVPNITKMDKRSILVDALAYLQGITQQIELEMEKSSLSSDSLASSSISSCNEGLMQDEVQPVQTTLYEQQCTDLPALSLMEADVLDEERLVLRIYCNKAVGALGHVYRTIEMLGLEITCITSSQFDQETLQTTAFLRAKKKGVMSQEKLLDRVTLNAKQLGLLLPPGK